MQTNNSGKTPYATQYVLSQGLSFNGRDPFYHELLETMSAPIYRHLGAVSSRDVTERLLARLLLTTTTPADVTRQLKLELEKQGVPPLPVSDFVTPELAEAFDAVAGPAVFKDLGDWLTIESYSPSRMLNLGKGIVPLMFNFNPDDPELSFIIHRMATKLTLINFFTQGEPPSRESIFSC